jgi:hypothetical protein
VVFVRSLTPAVATTGSPEVSVIGIVYIYQFNSSGTIQF